jgi:hypothetical protein
MDSNGLLKGILVATPISIIVWLMVILAVKAIL